MAGEDGKSFRLKMVILALSILALCFILYPVVLGARILDKTMAGATDAAPVQTSTFVERCREAFAQSPFAVASMFAVLTVIVVLSAGIVVYNAYLNKED